MQICTLQAPNRCTSLYMQVVQLLDHQLEILRQLPNVVRYNVISGQELCIVGDLHGQFEVRVLAPF